MAGKRYYWLKLKSDFFESKQMKKLRKIASGATYLIVYLKLQLLSLKTDGKLYFDGVEDTFAEELALEINESVDDVKMTMAFLQKFGLLEAESETEIFLPIVPTLVGKEEDRTDEIKEKTRQRVARHREKKRLEQGNASVTLPVTLQVTGGNALEKEKEKEIDIDIEKEKRTAIGGAAWLATLSREYYLSDSIKDALSRYADYMQSIGKPMNEQTARATIRKVNELAGTEAEAVAILDQTVRKGWKDVYALEKPKEPKEPEKSRSNRYSDKPWRNYEQRDFDYSEAVRKVAGYDEED